MLEFTIFDDNQPNPDVEIGTIHVMISEIIDANHYEGYFCDREELGISEVHSKGELIVSSSIVAGDNSDLQLKVDF